MRVTSMILALLAGLLSQVAIGQGRPPQDVNVVNNPDVNVANTVDVNVSNLPDVNVANTPDVTVTNTPDVRVVSLPSITIEDESVEPYISRVSGEDSPVFPATDSLCYFDVPEGKLLHIENTSGFTRKGNVNYLAIQPDPRGGGSLISAYRIPRAIFAGAATYVFDADGAVYAGDENIFTDATGSVRDFRVVVNTDGVGADTGGTVCVVTGRLFNVAP